MAVFASMVMGINKLHGFPQLSRLVNVRVDYRDLIQHALYVLLLWAALKASLGCVEARAIGGTQLQKDLLVSLVFMGLVTVYFMSRPSSLPVYLLDFSCYRPPMNDCKCSLSEIIRKATASGFFCQASMDFQRKVLERCGLGDETYGPPAMLREPPDTSISGARQEAEMVMFGALDDLFAKTRVQPKDVDILVVNCSLFGPSPSLPSVIINHYRMRGNIQSFNLVGMGCSAGVISVDLAKRLLQVHRNSFALVMTMENITQSGYTGNDRSKLLPNCIFRMGGAAVLLSNRRSSRGSSKYELVHSVRTHMGADDAAFRGVFQEEDSDGKVGVTLSKEIKVVAATLLKTHITTLGPLVLPLSQQILFAATFLMRKLGFVNIKPRIPDFKLAFEHFCVHAGGKAVLDNVEKHLRLTQWHMEPSRMTLYRFGNTSSSSPWYELAYIEAKGRVTKKGDRVWQLSFGAGFKCNSAVWRSLRSIKAKDKNNVWSDFIDDFPVEVPAIREIV